MTGATMLLAGRRRGAVLLERLLAKGEPIAGCIFVQDDPHEEPWAERLSDLAARNGVPHTVARSFRDAAARRHFEEWRPSVVVAENWRSMVSPDIYRQVPAFVVLHEALLPKYRGFAPLSWPIINGETETGVTLFHISEDVDAGDIVEQSSIRIGPHDSGIDIYEKTIPICCDLIERNLPALRRGDAPRAPQNHALATYACARIPEDGGIDWSAPTASVYNLIRALKPPLMPGAWTTDGHQKITIVSAAPVSNPPLFVGRVPGRVVEVNGRCVRVLTGDGIMEIENVMTPECPQPVPAAHVLRSIKLTLGRPKTPEAAL